MNMIPEQDLVELAKAKSIGWFIDDDGVNGGCKFTWTKYLELARAIEAMVKGVHSPPPLKEVAEVTCSRLLAGLLQKVIAYYEGQGKYNFSHLSDYDRDNAAFDAWQEIRQEIKEALSDYNAQKRKTVDKQDFNSDLAEKVLSAYESAPLIEEPFTACHLGVSAALEALAVNADWEAEDPKFLILRVAEQIRKNGHQHEHPHIIP